MAKYFLPDTNILVRSWTQGKAGCEMENWRSLHERCKSGEINLLVSEVVLLEAERRWQKLLDDIDTKFAVETAVKDLFVKPHDWSEIKDVSQSLVEHVVHHRNEKIATANHDEIAKLLHSMLAEILLFTQDVQFKAKRALNGRKIHHPNSSNPNRKDGLRLHVLPMLAKMSLANFNA